MPRIKAEGGEWKERVDKDRWPLLETLFKFALDFRNHLKIDNRHIFSRLIKK